MQTTLLHPITALDQTISLADGVLTPQTEVRIGGEVVLVLDALTPTQARVIRGYNSTRAVAHAAGDRAVINAVNDGRVSRRSERDQGATFTPPPTQFEQWVRSEIAELKQQIMLLQAAKAKR